MSIGPRSNQQCLLPPARSAATQYPEAARGFRSDVVKSVIKIAVKLHEIKNEYLSYE
jgi:hypothetical protein